MALTSFRPARIRSAPPSGSSRRARVLRAGFLTVAGAYGLLVPACSDDSDPVTAVGGSAGSGNGNGGSAGGGDNGGSAGTGSPGGSGGGGGSSGSNNMAGNGGSAGMDVPDAGPDSGGPDAGALAFELTSTAVDDVAGCGPAVGDRDLCDLFPAENTGLNNADNVSPQLDWTGAPAGTLSFAIAFHDLSNLQGQDTFTHWVMWNIPGSATGLPAELPAGTNPGVPDANTRQVSFGPNNEFRGSGQAGNVYEFVLYALDTASFDPDSTDPDEVQDAIESSNAILDTATLRARSTPP